MSGWRYAYLAGAGLLTFLLAAAPEAYRAACPICAMQDDVWLLQLALYVCVVLLAIWVTVAAFNIHRREFWWIAAPPYALAGGLAAGGVGMMIFALFL